MGRVSTQAALAPERLITVAAARTRDVLWAMEEALRCRAIGLVIGELRARDIDPVATRRLSLAAAAGSTLGLMLRPAPDEAISAAATRWIVAAAASSSYSPLKGKGRTAAGSPGRGQFRFPVQPPPGSHAAKFTQAA